MDIPLLRLAASLKVLFNPAAPGVTSPIEMGFTSQTLDLEACDFFHVLRLTVTSFGTGGNQITIDADSLAVTLGTGAVATPFPSDGVDSDNETISIDHYRFVGMRVTSAEDTAAGFTLSASAFKLIATRGVPVWVAVETASLIAGSGTWTITGPTGGSDNATIEIYLAGVRA